MNTVNFGAKFIQNKFIYKKDPSGKYLPEKVSIVELDTKNLEDIAFLKVLSQDLGNFSYAESLFSDIVMNLQVHLKKINQKILILTSQKENFSKMDTNSEKGFISYYVYPNNEIRVNYLEGLQNNFFNNKKRDYKHIGKALFNSMIEQDSPK